MWTDRFARAGKRKVAAVGYSKTQRGQYRPTTYMNAMSVRRSLSFLTNLVLPMLGEC